MRGPMPDLSNEGASPYSMGGGATPMMSPNPNQDSLGYNMTINGGEYSSQAGYDGNIGYDNMHPVSEDEFSDEC